MLKASQIINISWIYHEYHTLRKSFEQPGAFAAAVAEVAMAPPPPPVAINDQYIVNRPSTINVRSKNTKTLNTIERTMVPNIPCHYHDISQSPPALEFEDWFPFGSLE